MLEMVDMVFGQTTRVTLLAPKNAKIDATRVQLHATQEGVDVVWKRPRQHAPHRCK